MSACAECGKWLDPAPFKVLTTSGREIPEVCVECGEKPPPEGGEDD